MALLLFSSPFPLCLGTAGALNESRLHAAQMAISYIFFPPLLILRGSLFPPFHLRSSLRILLVAAQHNASNVHTCGLRTKFRSLPAVLASAALFSRPR